MKLRSLIIVFAFFATGCATNLDGSRYLSQSPDFELFEFFDGEVVAWGIVQNRSGEVVQRFTVTIDGEVKGDELTLDETFTYGLGEGVTDRTWKIEKLENGLYRGGASDILGIANGESFGNAFRWSYSMDLPVGEDVYRVAFDDWIFMLDEDRIVSRSYIQKFGLDVAEVTIFMERR